MRNIAWVGLVGVMMGCGPAPVGTAPAPMASPDAAPELDAGPGETESDAGHEAAPRPMCWTCTDQRTVGGRDYCSSDAGTDRPVTWACVASGAAGCTGSAQELGIIPSGCADVSSSTYLGALSYYGTWCCPMPDAAP